MQVGQNIPPGGELEQSSLTDLVAHIEQTHHVFTREQLDRVGRLLGQMDESAAIPLAGIKRCFTSLQSDLRSHLLKEERILFPYITGLEQPSSAPPEACFGSAANPIRVMRMEHDAVKNILAELRVLTLEYTSTNGDAAAGELYAALAALDADLVQHIHLEDNILFPRVLRLESGGSR